MVIAFVETHGRPVTESRIGSLEVVPRRVVDYRGNRFEEMDTEAVLRRRPQVALVDELAHTNVPGSGRHAKRWQDALELLDAEIDVVATVNIQHLESIADVADIAEAAAAGRDLNHVRVRDLMTGVNSHWELVSRIGARRTGAPGVRRRLLRPAS